MKIRELTEKECFALLPRARLVRLACAREGQPYVVPISLVYADVFLYGFTTAGQKVEWMRANPRVCVEWDEATSPLEWTSMVVLGTYEELPDVPEWRTERQRAHDLLAEGNVSWWQPGAVSDRLREPDHSLTPIYFRIRIGPVSGRRATS